RRGGHQPVRRRPRRVTGRVTGAMPRDLHPTDGARYLLERDGAGDAAQARYRATIYTPDAAFTTTAVLDDTGDASLAPSGAPAEPARPPGPPRALGRARRRPPPRRRPSAVAPAHSAVAAVAETERRK